MEKFSELVERQLNVKKVIFRSKKKSIDDKILGIQFPNGEVELDTKMTPELENEGFSREIMRRIQDLRKKSGLKKEDSIKLFIEFDVNLDKWKKSIGDKCGASVLEFKMKDSEFNSEGDIKDHKFKIGFNKN